MIISASRRTDIPAFYAEWFMNRVRAGWCEVPNPFRPSVATRISLAPEAVDAIAFWSKNPAPMLPRLDELDARGLRYYFLYTLNDYPAEIEPGVPPLSDRLEAFRALAGRVGPSRVVWRYDPIILSERMGAAWHLEAFSRLAGALAGRCERVIISFLDFYRKTARRLARVEADGGDRVLRDPFALPEFEAFARGLAVAAARAGLRVQSCAEDPRLLAAGIEPGKCIDDRLIQDLFGRVAPGAKDAGQRPACGCVRSKDIGVPDTCPHGCEYCYSTRSAAFADTRWRAHDPQAPALIAAPLTPTAPAAR